MTTSRPGALIYMPPVSLAPEHLTHWHLSLTQHPQLTEKDYKLQQTAPFLHHEV